MGRVIKAGLHPAASFPVNFEMLHAEQRISVQEEQAAVLEKAKTEAEIIVLTARSEAEAVLAEARNVGYEQGYREGMTEAATSVQGLLQRLESDIAAAETETNEFFQSIEPQLLKLCLNTVEKVIRHEVKTDPSIVIRLIKSCLRRIKESHEVRVRVNPSELAAVRAKRDELLSVAEGIGAVNIVDDRRVHAGGCIIETANGDFDATIETQMDRIEHKVTETFDDNNKTNPGS